MFKLTKYLGGKRYRSQCVKCGETVLWTEGEHVPMVFFQDEDIGFLCPKCFDHTRKPPLRRPINGNGCSHGQTPVWPAPDGAAPASPEKVNH